MPLERCCVGRVPTENMKHCPVAGGRGTDGGQQRRQRRQTTLCYMTEGWNGGKRKLDRGMIIFLHCTSCTVYQYRSFYGVRETAEVFGVP